jgi:hypothetical protein
MWWEKKLNLHQAAENVSSKSINSCNKCMGEPEFLESCLRENQLHLGKNISDIGTLELNDVQDTNPKMAHEQGSLTGLLASPRGGHK